MSEHGVDDRSRAHNCLSYVLAFSSNNTIRPLGRIMSRRPPVQTGCLLHDAACIISVCDRLAGMANANTVLCGVVYNVESFEEEELELELPRAPGDEEEEEEGREGG